MNILDEPLVSIITPLYNSEKYVAETIDSVLNQTYKNWEMLIVDDCSSDNGPRIVKKYHEQDKRIKYIKLDKNSGAAVARNKAIELAKGKYIAFLDSDDLWKSEKLEKQINFMKENEYLVSYSEYEEIDKNSKSLNILIKIPKKPLTFRTYLLTTPIGCLTGIYNVEKLGKIYMPLAPKREDAAFWLEILKRTRVFPLIENLASYRIHTESVSSNKSKLIKYQWKLYREFAELSVAESLFYLGAMVFTKVFKIKEKKYRSN